MSADAKPSLHQCNQCQELCRSLAKLKRHQATEHLSPPPSLHPSLAPSTQCGLTQANLRGHQKQHLKTQPLADNQANVTSFQCEHCSKSFARRPLLRAHRRRMHLQLLHFSCHQCPISFTTDRKREQHLKLAHTADQQRPAKFKCADCHQAFPQRRQLKTHRQVCRHRVRPFRCALCSQAYSLPHQLRQHIKAHHCTGKSSLNCGLCGVLFSSRSRLMSHLEAEHRQAIDAYKDEESTKASLQARLAAITATIEMVVSGNDSANQGGDEETEALPCENQRCSYDDGIDEYISQIFPHLGEITFEDLDSLADVSIDREAFGNSPNRTDDDCLGFDDLLDSMSPHALLQLANSAESGQLAPERLLDTFETLEATLNTDS